jgi:uncharacterized protein (DUF1800 family)
MRATLPPLERLDPVQAWQPFKPDARQPFDRKWAAHLYRRAGFGASRQELLDAVSRGLKDTLDLLLRGQPDADELLDTLNDAGRYAARKRTANPLRAWWLYVMLHGGHPLREKMTLFWHNHFATSIAKVQDPGLMFRQNYLIRWHALARFGPLLREMSRDGAMLVWLDSNSNVKGRPNENYARELMELFSLGVGNYTEKDIREAARAFTGWHFDGEGYEFNAAVHDDEPKTVLGRTGNHNGDDVVKIVLAQPACAKFLVRKLYRFFISEAVEPPDAFLEPLAQSFRASDYNISALLRTMLSSQHFFSEYAFRQRIKCPVEFVIGAVRAVYRETHEKDREYRPLPQEVLVPRMEAMGQQLFAPPNVKGWPGGRAWLNTSTMLARDNFAQALAVGALWTPAELAAVQAADRSPEEVFVAVPPTAGGPTVEAPADRPEEGAPALAFDPARILREEKVSSAEDIARVLLDLYLPGGIRPEARTKLVAFLGQGKPTGAALNRRTREAVHAILTMPEYQLA